MLELSLSVDNVFVIAVIFQYMRIPAHLQYPVLFWGILGAIVMRGIMIGAGAILIMRFQWVSYIFGLILILSAARMLVLREEIDPEKGFVIRLARKFYHVTTRIDGRKFFTRENGKRAATPLLVTLLMVEYADLMFAVDSVPAIFAVTRDPFLIFTSNVFAILGLRTLYFAVAGMMHRFRYIKVSLVFILVYVGVKMMVAQHYHIPNVVSLAMIASVLGVGIIASLWVARVEERKPEAGAASGTGKSKS